ncbi:type II secretion system protein GspJ [Desulfobotulus sp.]|jgi:type II secretion system protein J|uniref:type II secretion system protein GspJ n=1 Tax=Desulfobotulus sp. TaxID=1940337 RepID=UPI002A35D81A|nr:type II secretion system protein GspJ [Desulfobotulus sp.]MDY0162516.1 type II secretion system protein GspJ [Desulfobotulus sp.]
MSGDAEKPGWARAGFTLMEILVSLVILAIVMGASYASFSALVGTEQAMAPMLRSLREGQTAMTWITRDLTAAVVSLPPAYRRPEPLEDEKDPFRFEAWEDLVGNKRVAGLRFAADAHLPLYGSELKGVARISYTVGEGPGGDLVLFRSDDLHPYPDPDKDRVRRFVVCTGLQAFTLEFLDEKGDWRREWDSEDQRWGWSTPQAVRIRLETGKGADSRRLETEILIPVRRAAQGEV